MGLDIWFSEDIRNALLAAEEASSSTARICAIIIESPAVLEAYLEGYRAALRAVALAFGLAPTIIMGGKNTAPAAPELADEEALLVDAEWLERR